MRFQYLLAVAAIAIFIGGCGVDKQTETAGKDSGSSAHDHDHESHDHDHDGEHEHDDHPAHGPNHGHLFELDSPDYQGEWQKFKDNNVIKMHILDKDQNPAVLKVDSFHVIPMAGNDATPFVLEAESPDAAGKSSVYMLDDQSLSIAIPLGVNIEITMGDTVLKGKIDQHEPLDH